MKKIVYSLVILFISQAGIAQLRLPGVIGSGMVLQQKDSVNLWGWSSPGSTVFVTTGWDNRTDSTITSNGALWQLKVMTPAAGGPYSITISSGDSIKLNDVLIGEVWVCSGQSNMEMSAEWGEKDVPQEGAAANNPNIRLFHVPKATSQYPQDDVRAQWEICDSNKLKKFSSVAYFFAKKLNKELNVPVGLINSSWGGTPAEVWTPAEKIESDPVLKPASELISVHDWWPNIAGKTFNAMIAPLTKYNIAGAIWYQGEGNTSSSGTYEKLLTTMIDSWREAWNKKFPFYYVQIAPYNYGKNEVGALLQEQQTKAMSHPNVGMVVITDLIDSVTDIHPTHKKEVGYRLANWALAENYKKSGLAYKSPIFKSAESNKGKMTIAFDNVPTGLKFTGKAAEGFYIAGDDGQWLPAQAKIDKDKIIVWNKKIKDPRFVRYGFGNTIVGNASTAEGLPITPFRTDNAASKL